MAYAPPNTHHSRHLDERREMMQWWGNYLDQLRSGRSNVVPGSLGAGGRAQADGNWRSEVAKP